MELQLNNLTKQFDEDELTLQQLVDIELQDKQKGVAVAVNQHVVPKKDWQTFQLNSKDNVLIIKATQGG